jgi:hypothetical protein
MNVSQRMLVSIPSPKAQINASDERQRIVNYNKLLVVRLVIVSFCSQTKRGVLAHPVQCHIGCILKDVVIRVAQYLDVSVSGGAFRTKVAQSMLRMG